ncbi:hypothetical protein [Alistipes communis]|uniref:hypothetical protein n=1 Tax=Alistipes communis TaxID=2585118 RepID=UPI00266C1F06|nr:hypothetical protein [Alistipes communis]
MRKIMFNDRYGLTQAVIEGRKTMTRRLVDPKSKYEKLRFVQPCIAMEYGLYGYTRNDGWVIIQKYKIGEVVAVAQSYRTILNELENPDNYYCIECWEQDNGKRAEYAGMIYDPGYGNKLFTRADAMLHQIRITGIKCERLQDISDEDCFREGISESWYESTDTTTYGYADEKKGTAVEFDTPCEAFASLIDKMSGRGTWQRNPWVVAYEFELVK